MAKYPHFAKRIKFGPDTLRGHSSKIEALGYADLMNMLGRKELWPQDSIVVERGDYKPNLFVGRKSLTTGIPKFEKTVSRKYLPTGRPQEYEANLVELPADNGESLPIENVVRGYKSLGHFRNISAPVLNFNLAKSRDQKHFTSNDRVRNILRDNEMFMSA